MMRPMTSGMDRVLKSIEDARRRRARALAIYDEMGPDGKRKRTMDDVARVLKVSKQRASELVTRARRENGSAVPRGTGARAA